MLERRSKLTAHSTHSTIKTHHKVSGTFVDPQFYYYEAYGRMMGDRILWQRLLLSLHIPTMTPNYICFASISMHRTYHIWIVSFLIMVRCSADGVTALPFRNFRPPAKNKHTTLPLNSDHLEQCSLGGFEASKKEAASGWVKKVETKWNEFQVDMRIEWLLHTGSPSNYKIRQKL